MKEVHAGIPRIEEKMELTKYTVNQQRPSENQPETMIQQAGLQNPSIDKDSLTS